MAVGSNIRNCSEETPKKTSVWNTEEEKVGDSINILMKIGYKNGDLGGVVVIVIAIGHKVCGFKPGRQR
jgi:hypothetical protein